MSERQPMRGPWRVEADTLPEMAYDHYRHTLIHETSSIKAYLTPKYHERTILVAPKGYGKTLLLIAKKKSFLEARSGQIVMAENRFIDRPLGSFPSSSGSCSTSWRPTMSSGSRYGKYRCRCRRSRRSPALPESAPATEICWLMTGTAGSSLTTINILKLAKSLPIFSAKITSILLTSSPSQMSYFHILTVSIHRLSFS